MDIKETIRIIEVAIAEVEWNYPMDYAIAFEDAIEVLQKLADGRMIELPCKAGDMVYIIATCYKFTPRLDGTMYDGMGGYGTATGYYCPYENNCPFEADDCCSAKNKVSIFEDMVTYICIEDTIWIACENSNGYVLSDFGKTVFLTREDAEQALRECEQND